MNLLLKLIHTKQKKNYPKFAGTSILVNSPGDLSIVKNIGQQKKSKKPPIDPFLLAKNANFYKKTPKHL